MEFNERIKDLRISKNLSQQMVADFLGEHLTTYRRWETKENGIKLENAIKIARFYNVSIDYIACLTDIKSKYW